MEKAYLEVLLEEIRSRFDLVLEDHAVLHARIDAHRCASNERHELAEFLLGAVATDLHGQLHELRVAVNAGVDSLIAGLAAHHRRNEAYPRCRAGSRHSGGKVFLPAHQHHQ